MKFYSENEMKEERFTKWLAVVVAVLFLVLVLVLNVSAVSDPVKEKVCISINLSFSECVEFWEGVLNTSVVNITEIKVFNLTNNVTFFVETEIFRNITTSTVNNITYAVDTSAFISQVKLDNFEDRLQDDLENMEEAMRNEMKLYVLEEIEENPLIETIIVNNSGGTLTSVDILPLVKRLEKVEDREEVVNTAGFGIEPIWLVVLGFGGFAFYMWQKSNKQMPQQPPQMMYPSQQFPYNPGLPPVQVRPHGPWEEGEKGVKRL